MAQLGVSISSRGGFSPGQFGEYAAFAERAGFSAAFATENASDSLALASAMATATSTIAIGTAVANLYFRHPVLMALTAAAIDEASGGRFLLGLGTANPGFNQHTLGLPADPPLARTREYVAVVRTVLSGKSVEFDGEIFSVDGFEPNRRPLRPHLPIYLGALLPRMLRLAGEIADGLLLNLVTVRQARLAIEQARTGADDAGRDGDQLSVACVLPCCVSEDESLARQAAQDLVVGYALHPAAGALFADSGFADEMDVVRSKLRAGDRAAARAAVSEDMAQELVVHGEPHACHEQLQGYRDIGVDLPILFPVAIASDWDASIRSAIEAFSAESTAPTGGLTRPSTRS